MPRKPPGNACEIEIAVTWRLRQSWRAAALLRRAALHTARAERFRSGQLSIVVVGTRAMSTLHQRFMGQAGPTDVLTFDLGCDQQTGQLDAEIVICADVARRTARRLDDTLKTARAELTLYLVHGLLHLAGYDDHAPADFERMHAREDQLLTKLGLGRVFARTT